ncbi:lasso peptide biosynthesis B2 protein, partial [Xanthomonas sp. Kuri4-2]
PPFTPARRSAMESGIPAPRPGPLALAEVCALVLHTQWRLQRSPLRRVLARLQAGRHIAFPVGDAPHAPAEQRLCAAAAVYRRARLYVPVEMRCLLDSLALLRFLRRRQCHARLVFGVALDPFSAHCWVQADDLVLNDTVGNVHAHTPIRVV